MLLQSQYDASEKGNQSIATHKPSLRLLKPESALPFHANSSILSSRSPLPQRRTPCQLVVASVFPWNWNSSLPVSPAALCPSKATTSSERGSIKLKVLFVYDCHECVFSDLWPLLCFRYSDWLNINTNVDFILPSLDLHALDFLRKVSS